MQVDALIFDMDGVLVDTEPLHFRAWEIAMEEASPAVMADEVSRRAFRKERERLTGMASVEIAREIVRLFEVPIPMEDLLSRKRAIYRGLVERDLGLFPGLSEEIGRWNGLPKALVTSASRGEAEFMMSHIGVGGRFDPVVTADDVKQSKPAPDCYLLAAARMGKRTAECVVMEDSGPGIRSALDAGARVLAIAAPGSPQAGISGVLRVFPSTVEALQWLRA
jgi:HAD superfamily hydrolase (TIGR01509 family)